MATPLRLYNTLGRRLTPFRPHQGKRVTLYSCGPTVYNYAHLGNLRAYVFADVLKRVLRFNTYSVRQVVNITDVGHLTSDADEGDDKLETGARREGKTPRQIARFYERAFKRDVAALGILPPTTWARATEHIADQIAFIKKIERAGYAYQTDQAVYFDTQRLKNYTVLSGQKLAEKKTAAREAVHADPAKRHPADFVLWFKRVGRYRTHVLHWPSPWGDGFPGWHIECSAMSVRYLGSHIDIHTGGIDHIPVHHTNERAQNWAAYGREVVRHWLHNEFVIVGDKERMAKSSGNFLTLQSVIDRGVDPLAYRYLCLQTHYRKPLVFRWEALEAAAAGLVSLRERCQAASGHRAGTPRPLREQTALVTRWQTAFRTAVNDDLNTAQALAVVQTIVKQSAGVAPARVRTVLDQCDAVLGLDLLRRPRRQSVPSVVRRLVAQRDAARQNRDWATADRLRAEIAQLGYTVTDHPGGAQVTPLAQQ